MSTTVDQVGVCHNKRLFIHIYCSAQLFHHTLCLKTELSIVYFCWENLHTYVPRDIRTSSYRRCRSETSVENLLHKTKHVSSRPSPVLVHESEPSIIRWSYPPGYRYHSVLIRSTSVLGHLGPWSLQTFKKDRNDRGRIDQGPKCFNHFGTQDRSVHRTWYWCSSPGITTEGELERRKSQCSTNFWVYGTEMGACSTNFFWW